MCKLKFEVEVTLSNIYFGSLDLLCLNYSLRLQLLPGSVDVPGLRLLH